MARNTAKKRWITAIVLGVGVADCVGIYYAQHRLDTAVPDEVRFDRVAIMAPQQNDLFHLGQPSQLAQADVAPAPSLAPAKAPALTAPKLAVAPAVKPAVKAAPVSAPRLAAAVAPAAPPAAKAAPAPAPRAIVTPHLARVERPEPVFHAAPARLVGAQHSAALALAPAAPVARIKAAAAKAGAAKLASAGIAPAKAAAAKDTVSKRKAARSGLAALVPAPREHSEFSQAFAGFDSPVQASAQLELALPTIEPGKVGAPATDMASARANTVLDVPLPAPAVELPPVTATADNGEAKL
ncbi:hypothetical protein H7F51_00970 [Novosphingobium flavum]|uniref:Uncharacterized protein n=1 Tax=Novosphingobium flavum TaxID=1778672 RepID=A0A7X1FPC4_9SPHN|nr:hypothetical protein [Novosphingobium flavum]MBC2664082.1 hypothetical protein [Novosphingobium flavum]